MKIINLTQTQYRNYSRLQKNKNFGQTIEYSMLHENAKNKLLFLGLIDDDNNLHAATLIIIKEVTSLIKEAIAPNGYLIDYNNSNLVTTFTIELKKYLLKEKITYLITNPMFKLKVYNNNNVIIENNENIYHQLIKTGYKSIGYSSEFEKYDIIIENNSSPDDIFKNFSRSTIRNIKEASSLGITLKKGSLKDLDTFYNDIIKKKTTRPLSYYQNLFNTYNTKDNKMELFLVILNPQKLLINSKKLYEKELKRNELIHDTFTKTNHHITEKKLNKRICSDNILEKYHKRLNYAIKLDRENKDSIIIGGCIIIKNSNEIYFLIDGYNEKYRIIHTTDILKWAIIKTYYKLGYRTFNLGEIHQSYINPTNKYHGQYLYKKRFGGNIIEYPPNLLLVVNKPLYQTYSKLKSLNLIK